VVEEIVRLLRGRAFYKIVITQSLLQTAIKFASTNACDIFHLSCHGSQQGIRLTDGTRLRWDELAGLFQEANPIPKALVLSSCHGGDAGITTAFSKLPHRPDVIFGTEGENTLTFSGACISWPILYADLKDNGMTRSAFQAAVKKRNSITPHQFIYRRWDKNKRKYLSFSK
jgi:hypothetical protein